MQDQSLRQLGEAPVRPAGRTVLWSAVLTMDGRTVDCVIVNVSAVGATVSVRRPVVCSDSVQISCSRLGTLSAEPVWQNGTRIELRFREDSDAMALKLAEAILFS